MLSLGFGTYSIASSIYIIKKVKKQKKVHLTSMKDKIIYATGRIATVSFVCSVMLSVTF